MLQRVVLVFLLCAWANSGNAACLYNGKLYPEGAHIGDAICVSNFDDALSSVSIDNLLGLAFGSFAALIASVVLYRGAQNTKELRFFSASLYAASGILFIEVILVWNRFIKDFW